jgi:OOP family OmpA-OmpF porin
VPAAGAYVPQTQYDNTPSRFDMTQGGKRMSADDFDKWMRSKGFRVAKGAPPAECPNAPPTGAETIVGPDGCPVEVSIKLDGVTFEFAKNTLRPEAKATLDQAVEILKRHPELTVEVAGHTDSRGAADFNQKLSQARAKTVYDYLIEKGIDAKQLEGPIGYGESKPIASNDTDEGRNQNRRTELNIKAVAQLPAPAPAAGTPPVVLPATSEGVEGQAAAPASAAPAPAATAPATDATAPAADTPAPAEPAADAEKPVTPTP